MSEYDPTEDIRRAEQKVLNVVASEIAAEAEVDGEDPKVALRRVLEAQHGADAVYDRDQLEAEFRIVSFLAPYVGVERKSDGVRGTMQFTHMPRLYFSFEPEVA
jgi:hypothetical protein